MQIKQFFGKTSAIISLLLVTGTAVYAGSTSFESSFSPIVCGDGWVGCLFQRDALQIDSVKDSSGVFHPADARVSFLDLKPLPNYSPFTSIENYPAPTPVVQEEPVQEVAEVVEPKPETIVKVQKSQPSIEPAVKRPLIDPMAGMNTQQVEPKIEKKVEPEVVPEPVVVKEPTPPPPEPDAIKIDDKDCSDLVAMEGFAMIGGLSSEQKSCLDGKINGQASLTEKRNMSLLLINNAEYAKKMDDWDRLVSRHLSKIDQSDPNLCLKYAYRMSKQGAGKASQVIKWAETALENKHQWKGEEHKKNVYALYSMRAKAANALWTKAEQDLIASRSPENQATADKYRGQTKNFAREWLDYAKSSGQNVKDPKALCVSATQGDVAFCE